METGNQSSSDQPPKPTRALVLPGGGGRGAYQVGVVKALYERGIRFDYAFGTSIGGLNATMIGQQELDRLEDLWCNMRAHDIYRIPSAAQLGRLVLGRNLGLLDTGPLEELLRRQCDLHRLKQSPTKVGWCTTDLCSLQTNLVTIDDIASTNELVDILMATAALPIAFPPRHMHGEGLWMDGGLVRNTPLQAALDCGADEIYTVLLHPEKVNVCPANMFEILSRVLDVVLDASARKELQSAELYNQLAMTNPKATTKKLPAIKVFQPRSPISLTLLEIDPLRSRKLIKQGYDEANDQLLDYERADSAMAKLDSATPPSGAPDHIVRKAKAS